MVEDSKKLLEYTGTMKNVEKCMVCKVLTAKLCFLGIYKIVYVTCSRFFNGIIIRVKLFSCSGHNVF